METANTKTSLPSEHPVTPPPHRFLSRPTLAAFLSGSVNRRIFSASLLVAFIGLIVKAAALGKEMAVAWRFGISDDLDAFNVALLIPFAVVNVLAVSFQTAFVPAYIHTQVHDGADAAKRLLGTATIWLGGILMLCTSLAILGGKIYLPYLAPGFSPAKLQFTFSLFCLLGFFPVIAGVSGLWGAVLNARKRFALVAATPCVSIFVTLIFLFAVGRQGAIVLVNSLLAGAIVEALILGIALQRSAAFHYGNFWYFTPSLKRLLQQAGTLMLSNVFASATAIISVAMAAQFAAGSVSSLTYANKLIALLTGLAAAALSTVLMPYFVQMIAQRNWYQLRVTRRRFLQLTLGGAIPLTIVVILFAQPLTKIIFQRGAFAAEAVSAVAWLLIFLALQIPFYMGGAVLSRLLEAMQASRSLLVVTFASFVVCMVLTWLLGQKFQLIGIALATSLTYACSFFFLYFLAEHQLRKTECE